MVGWHHQLFGHEFEQALGVGDGQGSLAGFQSGGGSERGSWEVLGFSTHKLGFPGGSDGKEYACNAGDLGLIPGLGRSLEKGTLSIPVFWPGEFHTLYSSWDRKELDTTELSLTFLFHRAVCQD